MFDYFAQEHAEKLNNDNTLLQEMESAAAFSMIPYIRHILGAFLFAQKNFVDSPKFCIAKIRRVLDFVIKFMYYKFN